MSSIGIQGDLIICVRKGGQPITPTRNDYGVDIVAERNGVRIAVQCKRYGENISRVAVSDAVAGKHYYNCSQAMVVTNRHFRQGARELAGASQCLLVDRDALAGWIQSFQAAQTHGHRSTPRPPILPGKGY